MKIKMKKLNFGCGDKIWGDYDNVDIQKDPRLTKSFDFNKFPYPIKDNTYEYIWSRSVLEHLDNPERVLNELWRICKKGAVIEIIVPYYNNKAAYVDIQHKNYFSDITFINFCANATKIDKIKKLEIISLNLIPTRVGVLIPRILREKISVFLGGIISYIHVKLRVNK